MDLVIIILVTLALSGFFSGMEIAFISANKLRMELDIKQNSFSSGILNIFSNNSAHYISTMLIGNNLVLVIYGLFMAALLDPVISKFVEQQWVILLIQTIISTVIILFLGEFIPKSFFRINPNKTLRVFSLPLMFFYILFYPLAKFIIWLSKLFLKVFLRVKMTKNDNITFSKIDLDHLFNETQSNDESSHELGHDVKIFQNALDFSNVKLRECSVPRTEIAAVSIDDSIETLNQKFIETGYSKILVYKDSIDNIIGFAASVNMFKMPSSINEMVQQIPIVPETMQAHKLLGLFTQNKKSMALVVDEFGGTSGVVTMEDILEEIVGDIQDEHDKIRLIEEQLTEGEFKLSGRIEIDDFNEKYGLFLPVSDDYETIAGLILDVNSSIPKVNDLVTIDNYSFKILKATATKIELVHLKIMQKE